MLVNVMKNKHSSGKKSHVEEHLLLTISFGEAGALKARASEEKY